ncbi:membrane metallo-endopeptidase-like 1 isoform X4 [Anneissia japonica]|uniref:membrane metallo-endopeptidase-like 1 isoform X3 n=1 Tax=Anneissia japonica TaxID=1529436 RepID=UPI0014259C50|nr:membrane metallo-endopeptidase-like 1 isoform X3 [Anneissia japonica]XP_033097750.1 membrane metallo-endopeptidase-like 1 isoform X4 [Anneissia japonica]
MTSNITHSSSKSELFMEERKIQNRGMERVLMVTAVCLTFVVIGLIISTGTDRNNLRREVNELKNERRREVNELKNETDTCLTDHCVKMAGNLISNMNPEIDPCDNFFEFSCGGWERRYAIPEDQSSYSAFSVLREEVQLVLRDILSQDVNPEEPDSFRKARDFYKSCMDEDIIEEKDASPLIDLMEYLGGWPVLGPSPGGMWSSTGYKFEKLWAKLSGEFNNNHIISTYVDNDDKNSSRYILKIDQPELGMPSREYYLYSEYADIKEAYLTYMTTVATMLNGDSLMVKQDMADLLDFETKLANLTTPEEELRDNEALYNLMTLEELSAYVPLIDWRYFFDTITPEKVKPILDSEPIINRNPRFIREVSQLAVVDTPPRVIVNYFLWRLTMNRIQNMGERFRHVRQQYYKVLYGASSESSRFRSCTDYVNSILNFAVGRMYIDKTFTGDSKENTVEMIDYLREAFIEMLKYNDWMDEDAKIVAAEKCNAMYDQVGYPDWIKDDNTLDKEYASIDLGDSDYFGNVLAYLNWTAQMNFGYLREKVDKTEWSIGPALVNAFYSSSKNTIVFPAGILQPPFYNNKSPWYLNYGGIGAVIGHEITHGFDDRGRQYDKDGNLVQWWSDESIEKFTERAQCIIDQYDSYVMPENDMNLNGIQTQGENIADNGGLAEAYRAYRSFIESRGREEPLLPGLNYTQDQLFFINYAQVWCSAFRPEGATSQILSGVHSPGRYRAIGATHNSDDFARVFSCPKANPPQTKCKVW